jgi:hypothetical protein
MTLDELKTAISEPSCGEIALTTRGFWEAFPASGERTAVRLAEEFAEPFGFGVSSTPSNGRVVFKRF